MEIVISSAGVEQRTGSDDTRRARLDDRVSTYAESRWDRLSLGAFVLAASIAATPVASRAEQPSAPAACAAKPVRELRVHVINEAGAPHETIETARGRDGRRNGCCDGGFNATTSRSRAAR